MPYKIAVLCYLYDTEGRLLLLHRRKPPNRDMYSPIGGKLEIADGEGPHDCALREIREEASVSLAPDEIKLISIVAVVFAGLIVKYGPIIGEFLGLG